MPIKIVERDKKMMEDLKGQFDKVLGQTILVNVNNGFDVLLKNVQTGRPVIAYGEDPHRLGDPRFLGIFTTYQNIAYVTFPRGGWDEFLRAYRDLTRAPMAKKRAS